jgi:hypothetical protein
MTSSEMDALADRIEVLTAILEEQNRAKRLAYGDAARPRMTLDEMRERAAELRRMNDIAELETLQQINGL